MSLSIDRICRTCMAEGGTLMPIWPTQNLIGMIDNPSTIMVMLKSFTAIDALKGDGLPESLCISCISELNRAYSFKQKCERSESTLKMYFQQIKPADEQTKVANAEQPMPQNELIEHRIENASGKNMIIFMPKNVAFSNEANKHSDIGDQISMIYECSSCSERFISDSTLRKHLLNEHEAHYCEECNMYFNAAAYKEHTKEHDTQIKAATNANVQKPPKNFSCDICSLEFNTKAIFDQHCLKFHLINEQYEVLHEDIVDTEADGDDTTCHDFANAYENYEDIHTIIEEDDGGGVVKAETLESTETIIEILEDVPSTEQPAADGKFYCSHCNAVFAKQLSLNIHFNSKKCMQQTFECDICNRIFAKKKNLYLHIKTHSNKPELSCTTCKVAFKEKQQFQLHMKDQHPNEKKYKCTFCPKSFGMTSTLKDHLRTHSGERPFLCPICGKSFSQNTNLKQHLLRHNKTKNFKCEICDYSFVSKGELGTHLRKHTGDHPFVCDTCGSGFTTSSSLGKHKRIHTGERPYGCEFCPMRFAALGTLKNHRRTHTGEKPFPCNFCDRKFSQKSDCVSHARTHTGERPIACKECNLTFNHSATLKSHMKTHRKTIQQQVEAINENDVNQQSETLIEVI